MGLSIKTSSIAIFSTFFSIAGVASESISGGDIELGTGATTAPEFRIGLAAVHKETAYDHYDDDTTAAPLIMYQGERFYWMIAQGGYKFLDNKGDHQLAAIVEIGPDYWDEDDVDNDAFDPAVVGKIEDRDRSFNAGFLYTYRKDWGIIKLKAATDISDEHNGNYGDISYSYPFNVNKQLNITATVGVNFMDSDYATYYYGFEDAVGGRGDVDDAHRTYGSLTATYDLDDKWQLIGVVKAVALDDELESSSSQIRLADDDIESMFAFGITYKL